MATDTLFPDDAWVSIAREGGADVNITIDIDNFEEGGFEREIESRPFYHGAKVTIKKPQSDGELTLNAKITRALWDQILHGATGSDIYGGGSQDPYRIAFLVTKDTSMTSAIGELVSGSDAIRRIYANCYMTGFNPQLEAEGMLEGEATFTVSVKDENGDSNVRIQYNEAGVDDGFPALGSYTSSNKW
jgi:hypothetical protein